MSVVRDDTPPSRGKFYPYTFIEISALSSDPPLIKGVLDCSGTSVMYADSNVGKTFLALDMALHVAFGWDWCSRRTRKGKVVYLAPEAGLRLRTRLHAFVAHHDLSDLPDFYLIPAGVDFCSNQEDALAVIEELKKLGDVVLIVLDTLSRAMAGGNENSSDDMGKFIRIVDILREKTKAHIMTIHHAGKDTTRGARGHSSLRAAVDTEIELTKDDTGMLTAEIKKQRDGRTNDRYSFILESIQLGTDEDGDPVTSCVLVPTNDPPSRKKQKLSPQHQRAYSILTDLMAERGERGIPKKDMRETVFVRTADFRDVLLRANISAGTEPDNVRRQIQRIIETLNNKGVTATWEDKTWIVGQGGQIRTDRK